MPGAETLGAQHERAARAAPLDQAVTEWGRAAMAWLLTPEFSRAVACWVHQAEASEALACSAASQGARADHFMVAAGAWGLAGDRDREVAALEHAGLITEALEVWRDAGDLRRLTREAARWAECLERDNELLVAAEAWAMAGRPDRAAEDWRRLFAPCLPDGWIFEVEELRDDTTGASQAAVARVVEIERDWHRLEMKRIGEAADRIAVRDLWTRLKTMVAAVDLVDEWLQTLGGWALVSNERLPFGEFDGRWRLGARHVRSHRLVEVSDEDPVAVCRKLLPAVLRVHGDLATESLRRRDAGTEVSR